MEQIILDRLEKIGDRVEQILIQTTRTNGRVDTLEDNHKEHDKALKRLEAESNQAKGKNKVIWIVLSAVGAIVLLLAGYYLNKKS